MRIHQDDPTLILMSIPYGMSYDAGLHTLEQPRIRQWLKNYEKKQITLPTTEDRLEKERQKIEVTIPVKGNIIRSEQESSDMYVSIDLVEEIIERQLRKYKTKLIAKQQGGHDFRQEFIESDTSAAESDEIEIVRTKRFGIKPMFPEDACIQMELLGHNFYVFSNAETDEVNVVYKRKNGTYGLIEPEFQ